MTRARHRGTRLEAVDFLTPARPSVLMTGVLMFSAALLVTFVAPDLDRSNTSAHFAIWLVGNLAGAATITLFVAFVSPRIPAELLSRRAVGLVTLGALFGVGGFAAGLQRAHIDAWLEGAHSYPMAWPNVFGFTLMVMLLGLVGNGLTGLRTRLEQHHVSLAERVDELQRAGRLLVVSGEKLRRDIAEELHGRVQTRLVAAELMLDQARSLFDEGSPEAARTVLSRALNVIGEVRDRDVRALSHRLHPSTIRVVLCPALRSLLAGFEETFATRTSLRVDAQVARLDDPGDRRLHESVALIVYRAVEEALTNSQRHGRATEVDVDLAVKDDGRLHVTITDNGVGLPKSGRLARGLGLTSLEDRVEQRSGTCTIADGPTGGVVVSVAVPLRSIDLGQPAVAPKNGLLRRASDDDAPRPPASSPAAIATPRRYGRGARVASVLSK